MNCNDLHAILDAGALADMPPAEARAHLAACSACRRAWEQTRAALEVLHTLPEPPVPLDLAERILAFAHAPGKRQRRVPAIQPWGWALAAALLLGIGVGIFLTLAVGLNAPGYQVQDDTVLVPAGNVTTVRIALDATRPLQNVAFAVKIPAGMQLQGHPGEQQVAWNGELAQGRNVLNLELLAAPGAAGVVETDLHYGDHTSSFKLRVTAVKDTSLHVRLRRWLARIRAV